MGNWKQYILSVIICTLCCKVISQILSDTKRKALMHLISGIALAVMILQPLSEIRPESFLRFSFPGPEAADPWIEQGEKTAAEARAEYIKASCEAYFLEEANRLGTSIRPKIILDENLLPAFAETEGTAAPDVQIQLQTVLTEALGIPKENQTWIWNQENSSS